MYVLSWHNFEDQQLNALAASDDLEKLKRLAFEAEKEFARMGEPEDEDSDEFDWDSEDWFERVFEGPGHKTTWHWAPEWFQAGNGYQIEIVTVVE